MTSTGSTTACRHLGAVEDWKQLLRSPRLNVDFLTNNPPCRLQHCLVLASSRTKIAVTVRWNVNSYDCGSQMSRMTEKFNWAFPVAFLQFAVGRAHSTH